MRFGFAPILGSSLCTSISEAGLTLGRMESEHERIQLSTGNQSSEAVDLSTELARDRWNEVLVFQHDPFEDLGFFAEVLEKQGTDYRVVRLFHGEMPAEELEGSRAH